MLKVTFGTNVFLIRVWLFVDGTCPKLSAQLRFFQDLPKKAEELFGLTINYSTNTFAIPGFLPKAPLRASFSSVLDRSGSILVPGKLQLLADSYLSILRFANLHL